MIANLTLLLFPLLMAFAAFSDIFTMRISNRLVLVLVGGFLAIALAMRMPLDQFGMHLLAAGIVLVCAFICFAFGWVGGGDAKLAAATTLWLGFALTLPYLVYAALLGGMLTFFMLAVRRWPLPKRLAKVGWIDRLHDKKSGVPYGVTLAAAGLLTYSDTAIFQHFVG